MVDLFLHTNESLNNLKTEVQALPKRMESSQNGFDEENQEPKETKS